MGLYQGIFDPEGWLFNQVKWVERYIKETVEEMNRITREVVLGIKGPKREFDEAMAFRKGVKKEIRQTAKMARKLGINYTVELLSDW